MPASPGRVWPDSAGSLIFSSCHELCLECLQSSLLAFLRHIPTWLISLDCKPGYPKDLNAPLQDFSPDVIVFDNIMPMGSLMADLVHAPKVGISLSPPFAPLVNLGARQPRAPALMPQVPYWKHLPMVRAQTR